MSRKTSTYIDKIGQEQGGYILGQGVSKATYNPEPPPNPSIGDLWVDADDMAPTQEGRFISSDSIMKAAYDPLEPENPQVGDLWLDAAAESTSLGSNIPPSSIVQNENNRFVTDTQISQWNSSGLLRVFNIISNTTITQNGIYLVNDISASVTLNLPSAIASPGMQLIIKKTSSAVRSVAIIPYSYQQIDNFDSIPLSKQNDTIHIVSNGTKWFILFRYLNA